MQLSIGKLVATLVMLLITVAFVTTGAGMLAAHRDYRTLDTQNEMEAKASVHNAALAVHNQIDFYQAMLQLVATKPDVSNLLEFSELPEIVTWSQSVDRLLPGTLGTALSRPDGLVFGDPLRLHVGPACQADLRRFATGQDIEYPLLHTDRPGLQHFDLLAPVTNAAGETPGTLFVSFRLEVLKKILDRMLRDGDRFQLIGSDGKTRLTVGATQNSPEHERFSAPVPGTAWRLDLFRQPTTTGTLPLSLILTDIAVLLTASLMIVFLVRLTLSRFKIDLLRIHQALEDVLAGDYRPNTTPTAIKETGILLPDIEQLALKIKHQHDELRHQSLSDPLTGVFNRRYFDLMLAHHHDQSRRQQPAIIVIIDLNDFKQVNDNHGHAIGDGVLQDIADHLTSRVRASDIVARLGGDEFALILNHMADMTLEDWLRNFIDDFDRHSFSRANHDVPACYLSLGAASIDARRYPSPSAVFHAADEAMYSVKKRRQPDRSLFATAPHDNIKTLRPLREVR